VIGSATGEVLEPIFGDGLCRSHGDVMYGEARARSAGAPDASFECGLDVER
jgi:hypothetical protein